MTTESPEPEETQEEDLGPVEEEAETTDAEGAIDEGEGAMGPTEDDRDG